MGQILNPLLRLYGCLYVNTSVLKECFKRKCFLTRPMARNNNSISSNDGKRKPLKKIDLCGQVTPCGDRTWSTLVQVLVCCLTVPSHYLNQCWFVISDVLWFHLRAISQRETILYYKLKKHALQNRAAFPRDQWVNKRRDYGLYLLPLFDRLCCGSNISNDLSSKIESTEKASYLLLFNCFSRYFIYTAVLIWSSTDRVNNAIRGSRVVRVPSHIWGPTHQKCMEHG